MLGGEGGGGGGGGEGQVRAKRQTRFYQDTDP